LKKRIANVVLRQGAIERLIRGGEVTIRFDDLDIEVRLDPLARIGGSGNLEDMISESLRLRSAAVPIRSGFLRTKN
jgi:hypothetical protein